MSNMKNANRLVVAHGPVVPEVLEFIVKDFGRLPLDIEEIEDMVATEHIVQEDRYFVADNDMDTTELSIALECLHDHLQHDVIEDELRDNLVSDDYMCASPDHHSNHIECHCGLDTCEVVRVYEHTYYAPGCVMTCYYVVLADA